MLKITIERVLICERCKRKLSCCERMIDYQVVSEVELCTCHIEELKRNRMEEEENAAN